MYWNGKSLRVELNTSSPGHTIMYWIAPQAGYYVTTWSLQGSGEARRAGLVYEAASAGHWYGYGESQALDQPWPLSSGRVPFGMPLDPSIYQVRTPFWFTSSGAGVWVNTYRPMDHSLNHNGDGLARWWIKDTNVYRDITFVENTAGEVHGRYVRMIGLPAKSDTTYEQFEKPLWNSWAMFYRTPDQEKVIKYAEDLAANNLPGHAVQIDGGWERRRGDLEFDPERFPDPATMSKHIHAAGFDLGLWMGFWIEPDSANFRYAKERGYLLASAKDPMEPCLVPSPFERDSAVVDLANPEAYAWYEGKLRDLMARYGVEGFKFDTVFFDERCQPRSGSKNTDYARLGARFVDGFDLQGVGMRTPWFGPQRNGFVVRQMDKSTDWHSLRTAVPQALAISTAGYPFVETDVVGGSLFGSPPEKAVLVRWAQAASLMPLMYASTSPLGVSNPKTGETNEYDQETVDLYRAAIEEHGRLAPYIWDRAQEATAMGEPIMKPLFFDFPDEGATYTIKDQWMLGDAVMAAPVLSDAAARDVYVPAGEWHDVRRGVTVAGPTVLKDYPAPLDTVPVFVRQGTPQTEKALEAFSSEVPRAMTGEERIHRAQMQVKAAIGAMLSLALITILAVLLLSR
jgi:alpha-glucosidase (family GH31 glycosyl hydrolase)